MKQFFHGVLARFFWINALACVGMNIGIVGVNWFIIDATHQNALLGLYGAVSLISAFLTLACCGELTDRLPKLSLLRYCCIGQAFLFFLTALARYFNIPVLWIIYALAVLNMPLMVVFSIVSRGAVADIWPSQFLSRGNAIIEITLQIGAMCAAFLTGFLYHTAGFGGLMALGSFLTLTAGLLVPPAQQSVLAPVASHKSYWQGLYQGTRYLCQHIPAAILGLVTFLPTIIISVSNTVIPGYVEQTLQQNARVYGISDICFAIGALLAGIWGGRNKTVSRSVLSLGFGLVTVGLIGLTFNRSTGLFYSLIFIIGYCLAKLRIVLNTVFMQVVDKNYLGRCLSLLMAFSMLLQAVLAYVVGKWMDLWGAPSGYIVLAVLAVSGLIVVSVIRVLPNAEKHAFQSSK